MAIDETVEIVFNDIIFSDDGLQFREKSQGRPRSENVQANIRVALAGSFENLA